MTMNQFRDACDGVVSWNGPHVVRRATEDLELALPLLSVASRLRLLYFPLLLLFLSNTRLFALHDTMGCDEWGPTRRGFTFVLRFSWNDALVSSIFA